MFEKERERKKRRKASKFSKLKPLFIIMEMRFILSKTRRKSPFTYNKFQSVVVKDIFMLFYTIF